jgi:CRISPR-associated protein Csc1
MRLYHCELELHENLFFASREMGRLYECESYLHNYALAYALGLAQAPYFQPVQVPNYQSELAPLNARGIYVTPAAPVTVTFELATFKYANNSYHVEMGKARSNTPSFGRAKELAVESRFKFGVLATGELPQLPRWIRLGLWRSKAHLTVTLHELEAAQLKGATLDYPLNPLDLPDLSRVPLYDLISLRPTSLLHNARYSGPGWRSRGDNPILLPADLAFRFPERQ